jgi:uncharacterized protein YjbI with pentapeptide repeats
MSSKRRPISKSIVAPQLPETLPSAALPPDMLADHCTYSDTILEDAALPGQAAQGVTFDTVHFKHVRLGATLLQGLHLRDVRFDTCDLAAAAWDRAQMARVEFTGSRLLGFKSLDSRLQDILFKECNCTLALFGSTTFKAVRFQSCELRDASFYDADLSAVVFDRCDLRGADLRGAKLAGADFRGSQVEGMSAEGCDMRGVIIEPTQAPSFAELLGLVVRWDG